MGIINRSLDTTEQQEIQKATVIATTTGVAYPVYFCPRAMQIQTAKSYAQGLSGAPTTTLQLQRFVPGAGATTISISGALTNVAFGTSGIQTFSMPAAGSSLLNLQEGDVIVATAGGSNAALTQLMVEVVVQSLQDYKTWF